MNHLTAPIFYQNLLLKAFLTTKYGGKLFFGAGIGICSVLTLLTPLAASIGPGLIIILRTLQGLAQVLKRNWKKIYFKNKISKFLCRVLFSLQFINFGPNGCRQMSADAWRLCHSRAILDRLSHWVEAA